MQHPQPPRPRHRGMVTAPNALASQSALAILREGGNAVEGHDRRGAPPSQRSIRT